MAPDLSRIVYFAQCIESNGADALTIANTFMSTVIDIDRMRPVLGNIFGGLSGPAIKPIVMGMVYKTYKHVNIPIIASGGITCWQDAVEYLLAGASALQIGCTNFVNPMVMPEVIAGIENYMVSHGKSTLNGIIGASHK